MLQYLPLWFVGEKTVGNDSGCGEYGEGSSGILNDMNDRWSREEKKVKQSRGRLYSSKTKLIMIYL